MKKAIISMALLLSVGTIMGQVDKAALKLAQKEAKAQMAEAQKINQAIIEKINAKSATEDEVISECRKGQALIRKAIKSETIADNKLGEAYKLSADMANHINTAILKKVENKEPFDTAFFYTNLKTLTGALQGEIKHTKVTTGEAGNERYLKGRAFNLAQCGNFYLYAAQICSQGKQYERALDAFSAALNYTNTYPEVANQVKLSVPNEQIAYYAFITAYDGKLYDKMDQFYDQAILFQEGAIGVKQRKAASYKDRGDMEAWAKYVHEMTVKEPQTNEDFISMLISYYLDKEEKGGKEVNLLVPYVDEIIAADPNNLIAYYGKAYKYFKGENYEEAFKTYLKCTEIKSDYFDAWFQCGLCKYRQALALNETVSSIKNQILAKTTKENARQLFAEAIPYLEKARDCAPDEPTKWAILLRDCYDVTGQKEKAAEMDKLF